MIVLNLSHRPAYFKPKQFSFKGTIEFATTPEWEGNEVENALNLAGDGGAIIQLE